MLVRFMEDLPWSVALEKVSIKCEPRILIPEKGIAYFSRNDCKNYSNALPQISVLDGNNYYVSFYCDTPSDKEGGELTTIAQLEKFNLVGADNGCYGRGLFYPDISINFLIIRNKGKPHIDVDVEMFKQLAILLRNAYQN